MSLTVNAGNGGGGDFENCPAGSFAARCYQIIDLGHQTFEWKGEAKVAPKVRITWELNEPSDTNFRSYLGLTFPLKRLMT